MYELKLTKSELKDGRLLYSIDIYCSTFSEFDEFEFDFLGRFNVVWSGLNNFIYSLKKWCDDNMLSYREILGKFYSLTKHSGV